MTFKRILTFLCAALFLHGGASRLAAAADINQQYRVSLGGVSLNVPSVVILCPSSDGSFTPIACDFSGGGSGGSVTQGTVPWVTSGAVTSLPALPAGSNLIGLVGIAPPTSVPSPIDASLPALGATPTLIAAAGTVTKGFSIYNGSTVVMLFSVTAAAGTTLTYANAIPIPVGGSFTSPDWMPVGGALQVQSATATACASSSVTPCAQGFYK